MGDRSCIQDLMNSFASRSGVRKYFCTRTSKKALTGAFVFTIRIVHSLYYLCPKFQASSHLLWLYSPVYVGPSRKPRRPVFSQRGSSDMRLCCLHMLEINMNGRTCTWLICLNFEGQYDNIDREYNNHI